MQETNRPERSAFFVTSVPFILLMFILPQRALSQREDWIKKPRDQWPQIALINHVLFLNGDRYVHPSFSYAGTGFLINTGRDTLAASAKHVLWIARNKNTKTVELNDYLLQWTMAPKGNNRDSVVIEKLLNEDSTEILEGSGSTILERDWIVFAVKKSSANIYPLKPRYTEVRPGEKIFVASCAYNDSVCTVYEGSVIRKLGMDIIIEMNMKEGLGGSSGSPVIDSNGFLIGVISSYTSDPATTKPVAVAVSTAYLKNVIDNKKGLNDPKKDYGEVVFTTVIKRGAKKAIKKYEALTSDPANYYLYNLRSANRNGLRETGEKLIALNRLGDAIAILEFNVKINSTYFLEYNILAKAYLLSGDRVSAMKYYKISTEKYSDKNENDAFRELEKMKN